MPQEANDYREFVCFGPDVVVVVDGALPADGGVQVMLDQFEAEASSGLTYGSEEELRDALVKLGAYEAQAATTAALVWRRERALADRKDWSLTVYLENPESAAELHRSLPGSKLSSEAGEASVSVAAVGTLEDAHALANSISAEHPRARFRIAQPDDA